MEFLSGIGEFMAREGISELEIVDGDCVITLRRGCSQDHITGADDGNDCFIAAPLSGILHLSESPGEPPYVTAGERRKQGDILFCIEAMKHTNEIYAEFDLVVDEVLVEENESVTEGQAILRTNKEDGSCGT